MTYNYLSQADFLILAFNLCKWLLILLTPLALLEYIYDTKNKQVIVCKGKGILELLEQADYELAVNGEIDFSKFNAR